MAGAEQEALLSVISQLITIIIVSTIILVAIIKLGKWCLTFIEKRRITLKLKKYELSKYDIYFDNNGLPVTIVEKNTNKIIFI